MTHSRYSQTKESYALINGKTWLLWFEQILLESGLRKTTVSVDLKLVPVKQRSINGEIDTTDLWTLVTKDSGKPFTKSVRR